MILEQNILSFQTAVKKNPQLGGMGGLNRF